MSSPWEPLTWDGTFFGLPVVRLAPQLPAQELAAALDQLRESGVRLVYWVLERPDEARARSALAAGALHVDDKTTFHAGVNQVLTATASAPVETRVFEGPAERLRPLALAAGARSRFRVDPKVGVERFERLYTLWLEGSLRGELAEVTFVTGSPDAPTGFVTVGRKQGRADIGLIAVDPLVRGQGCGKALVRRAAQWAREAGLERIQVVTQGENREACALYERCAFDRESVSPVFHFWLEAEPLR